jgi:hypothetical protein
MRSIGSYLLCNALSASFLMAQGTASIRGRVELDDGGVISGATVVAVRASATTRSPGPVQFFDSTRSDGTFAFTSLEPGTYKICAQAPGTPYVNECLWDLDPLLATVGTDVRSPEVVLRLKRGVPVDVRIEDPGNLLEASERERGGAQILVGIIAPSGLFHPTRVSAKTGEGRSHSIVVPFDTSVKIAIRSRKVVLDDQDGNRVQQPGDSTISFSRSRSQGDAPQQVVFRLVALEPDGVN